MQFIGYTGFAGVAALVVWRIVIPWSDSLLNKRQGTSPGLEGKVNKLETNDLYHLKKELEELKKETKEGFSNLHGRVNTLVSDVSFIKGRLNGQSK